MTLKKQLYIWWSKYTDTLIQTEKGKTDKSKILNRKGNPKGNLQNWMTKFTDILNHIQAIFLEKKRKMNNNQCKQPILLRDIFIEKKL